MYDKQNNKINLVIYLYESDRSHQSKWQYVKNMFCCIVNIINFDSEPLQVGQTQMTVLSQLLTLLGHFYLREQVTLSRPWCSQLWQDSTPLWRVYILRALANMLSRLTVIPQPWPDTLKVCIGHSETSRMTDCLHSTQYNAKVTGQHFLYQFCFHFFDKDIIDAVLDHTFRE